MTKRVVLKTGTGKYEKTPFLGYQLKKKKQNPKPEQQNTESFEFLEQVKNSFFFQKVEKGIKDLLSWFWFFF